MDHDDSPKTDTQVAFLFSEYSLRERVVVQTQLNGKANEATNQSPE